MPPRLSLSVPRVPRGGPPLPCVRHAAAASTQTSAYGSGLLFDLLTPALKFRARHASAHAMQQKVVDADEDVCVGYQGPGGGAGMHGNAEAGPSRLQANIESQCAEHSAEMPRRTESVDKGADIGIERVQGELMWSAKGKERSWLSVPLRETSSSTPDRRTPAPADRMRQRQRVLYPGYEAFIHRAPDTFHRDLPPHQLSDQRRHRDSSPPCPQALVVRYRLGPATRAYGELIARYARRVDDVKAESAVKDIMGRARIAPLHYIDRRPPRRKKGIRRTKPPDDELLLGSDMEMEGVPDVREDGIQQTEGPTDLSAGVWTESGVGPVPDEQDQYVDAAPAPERKTRTSKRRARKARMTGAEVEANGSPPQEEPQAELGPSTDMLDEPPRHPNAPDRAVALGSLRPNIRASRAWPIRSVPFRPLTPTEMLQTLHHHIVHPTKYSYALSLTDALDLMRMIPTHGIWSCKDVLHLFLTYADYQQSMELLGQWREYWSRSSNVLPQSEAVSTGDGQARLDVQTLHLAILSTLRSPMPSDFKYTALQSTLDRFAHDQVLPGHETIRHLVHFCLSSDDVNWCRRLVDEWWAAYARHGLNVDSRFSNVGPYLPSPTRVGEEVNADDPAAFEHVPFRFARRGRALQRWFKLLRRLERKGWVRRVDDGEDVAVRPTQGERRAWRGGYVWQGAVHDMGMEVAEGGEVVPSFAAGDGHEEWEWDKDLGDYDDNEHS